MKDSRKFAVEHEGKTKIISSKELRDIFRKNGHPYKEGQYKFKLKNGTVITVSPVH